MLRESIAKLDHSRVEHIKIKLRLNFIALSYSAYEMNVHM